MAQNWYPQLPAWARQQKFPNLPFMGVAAGQRSGGGFNPGGQFGPGKNVLPSVQRWNRLAPSEQQGYTGYLEDELGVYSGDVFDLMNRLRPRGAVNATPRWVG